MRTIKRYLFGRMVRLNMPCGHDRCIMWSTLRSGCTGGACSRRPRTRTAMEAFATAVAQLLKCGSCYVAVLSHASDPKFDEMTIGQATADPACAKAVARLARRGAGARLLCFSNRGIPAPRFTRKLLGSEPGESDHSVIGRFSSGNGDRGVRGGLAVGGASSSRNSLHATGGAYDLGDGQWPCPAIPSERR